MQIFDFIAPVYGLLYGYQKRHFNAAMDKVQKKLDLSRYKKIIDIGCGTGAFCSVLYQKGFTVTGVDNSKKMLGIAEKKHKNKNIGFILANILEGLPFEDKSFDVSFATHVAHGLKAKQRKIMYTEMSRITKHLVIIHDYNQERSLFTNIIELLEGGDYFNFIKEIIAEAKENFKDIFIIEDGFRSSWYVCMPSDQ